MNKIILASGNKHKVEEIRKILSEYNMEILSKTDIGYGDFETEEDGDTLEENAEKKARELWEKTGEIVIADDTGLFVEYLKGEPGVYSARYAGENVTYKDNNELLLSKMKGVHADERTAYFKTVMAVVDTKGNIHKTEGICTGSISEKPEGENGFGYDPLFIVDGTGKTFAQLSSGEKNILSHRGKAVRNLKAIIGGILSDEDTCI